MTRERKALKRLKKKTDKFLDAIIDFGNEVNLDTVGLDGWIEHIEEVMFDIEAELDSNEDE